MLKGPGKEIAVMIESLPQYYLWRENKRNEHGTGHGVGTALYEHESPPKLVYGSEIKPHQVFTIEPGYYKENSYGIRIEDSVISLIDDNIFLKKLTFLSLQLNLIDTSMLNDDEVEYLNAYNENVRNILGEYIKDEDKREWLINNT